MSVVVADFGLARVVRDSPGSSNYLISSTLPPSVGRRLLPVPGNKPPPPKKRYQLQFANISLDNQLKKIENQNKIRSWGKNYRFSFRLEK